MNRLASTFGLLAAMFCAASGCKEHHKDHDEQQVHETRHWTLPPDLQPITEGAKTLDYKADGDGRVYVTDVDNNNEVVSRKHIRAGQMLTVSPSENQITIDGRSILYQDLNKTHSYRIYFEKE